MGQENCKACGNCTEMQRKARKCFAGYFAKYFACGFGAAGAAPPPINRIFPTRPCSKDLTGDWSHPCLRAEGISWPGLDYPSLGRSAALGAESIPASGRKGFRPPPGRAVGRWAARFACRPGPGAGRRATPPPAAARSPADPARGPGRNYSGLAPGPGRRAIWPLGAAGGLADLRPGQVGKPARRAGGSMACRPGPRPGRGIIS